MATINNNAPPGNAMRKKAGVRRILKHTLKVDMTPMVDLGFLLITFFVITTELSKPSAMDIAMPKDGPPMELASSNSLTIILDGDKLYYYTGEWKEAIKNNTVAPASFTGSQGLRYIISKRQQYSAKLNLHNEGSEGLMVLIKPGANASYKKVVDVLDEMQIMQVKKFALINLDKEEKQWLENKQQQ